MKKSPKMPKLFQSNCRRKYIQQGYVMETKKMPKMPKMETFGNEKVAENKFFKYKNNLLFNSINTK